ncbi:unnamed protein product [Didymodactylos carnosus]|uniref:Uncharacterized protein n=1 Tax=Didymodactylos carnosus TaxID=1234261 RepID=A0A816BMJ1_9BILA|nr:unnamed protein product [Didymodactylos carnosus]CAF1611810.1 unnamed protein product [Didymodactylos carnosus]CAF4200091.1 unnamed protein product [Didymodactylos carnosus]CAF4495121.1 unnamed protein product [Didymodactylos carnosus]
MIWQTTANELKMKEYEEILRKRIYLQRLPSRIDKIINPTIDPIQLLLANPMLNKDRRVSGISNCSKTILQYEFDLMTINLDTMQNIRHGHEELRLDLQNKLSQSNWTELIKQSIENRRQAMIERLETYLKHKLNTFFDAAPMASKPSPSPSPAATISPSEQYFYL